MYSSRLEEIPPRVLQTRDLMAIGDLLSPPAARALHELLLLLPLRGE